VRSGWVKPEGTGSFWPDATTVAHQRRKLTVARIAEASGKAWRLADATILCVAPY